MANDRFVIGTYVLQLLLFVLSKATPQHEAAHELQFLCSLPT